MPIEEKCHICGEETEFHCTSCDEPVCVDDCVPMTYMNQIDYALCTVCGDAADERYSMEANREWEQEEELKKKKAAIAAKRKKTYWKPENVAKRKAKKEKDLIERIERERKMMEEAVKTVNDMFRGMF